MVLNDEAVHSDETGGGKVESARIKIFYHVVAKLFTRLSLGKLDKNSNAKQLQTSASGKSNSPNILFKN